MQFNSSNFDIHDIIAVLFIIGGFVLMWRGIDSSVTALMTMIAGYYFGRKMSK